MILEWLLIIGTIFLSGFFSGSEIAFVSANRLKLEILMRKNTINATYLSRFVSIPERFLITILVGNNIINVIYATLMTLYLSVPVSEVYLFIFNVEPSPIFLLTIQTLIASAIVLFFGEIIPKAIFRSRADWFMRSISIPIRITEIILSPLIYLANIASIGLLKLFRVNNERTQEIFRRQDIEMILEEMQTLQTSDLDKDETELLSNVLELSSKRVKDSMITRTEIIAIEKETPVEDALKAFVSSGYSKLPIYDETIDNIIGVIFATDLFHRPAELKEIQRPVQFVPSSKRSKDLLTEFRKNNTTMAVVLDEYGGTAGLVTIEDLIEEVVGDIEDEYDTTDHLMKKLNQNTFVISGMVEIEDLMEKFPEIGIEESDSFETVAGYIIHHIGRIPKVNEELIIERNKCIISKASPARIETVRIIILPNDY
jgi:putative hemolysin